ncbi:MAG TPA: family 43 glycosylhydrolase, partial [Polyangiaceae bacterium]
MPCVPARVLSAWLACAACAGCSSGSTAEPAQAGATGADAGAAGAAGTLTAVAGAPNAPAGGSGEIGGGGALGTSAAGHGAAADAAAGGMSGSTGSAPGQGGALAAGTGGAVAGSAGALGYPPASSEHRAIGTHDPSMLHVANSFYLFGTGGLLNVRSSTNLAQWTNAGSLFSVLPAWIKTALGQSISDLWAPDVSYVNGTYRVYYAGSLFGSNHSVIGLATNTTLDRQNAGYVWVDQGLVIESNAAGSKDDWNAIDPNATL